MYVQAVFALVKSGPPKKKDKMAAYGIQIAPQERIAIENAFSNIKKFGFFHRVKSRGGLYEYNQLTYFFLAACALQNSEIQFDLQNGCKPTAERPCKCA